MFSSWQNVLLLVLQQLSLDCVWGCISCVWHVDYYYITQAIQKEQLLYCALTIKYHSYSTSSCVSFIVLGEGATYKEWPLFQVHIFTKFKSYNAIDKGLAHCEVVTSVLPVWFVHIAKCIRSFMYSN